jgi:hypothetical protein
MTLPAKVKENGDHQYADPEAVQLLIVENHRRHPRQRRIWQKEEAKDWPERRMKGPAEPVGKHKNEQQGHAGHKNRNDREKATHDLIPKMNQ